MSYSREKIEASVDKIAAAARACITEADEQSAGGEEAVRKQISSQVGELVSISNQLHTFHWDVPQGDFHQALNDAYDEYDELMDSMVETVLGQFPASMEMKSVVEGAIKIGTPGSFSDATIFQFINDAISKIDGLFLFKGLDKAVPGAIDAAKQIADIKVKMSKVFAKLAYKTRFLQQ